MVARHDLLSISFGQKMTYVMGDSEKKSMTIFISRKLGWTWSGDDCQAFSV